MGRFFWMYVFVDEKKYLLWTNVEQLEQSLNFELCCGLFKREILQEFYNIQNFSVWNQIESYHKTVEVMEKLWRYVYEKKVCNLGALIILTALRISALDHILSPSFASNVLFKNRFVLRGYRLHTEFTSLYYPDDILELGCSI